MIKFTDEQHRAYDRYIRARDKVFKRKEKWVRMADVKSTVDITGLNHPLYEANPEWEEYKESFKQWLLVEPEFREKERMRSSRGDYGVVDSWEDKPSKVKEL